MSCRERERQIILYACGELDAAAVAPLDEHLKECVACAARLESERRLLSAVSAAPAEEPSPVLLAQCRLHLSRTLDQTPPPGGWARLFSYLWPVLGSPQRFPSFRDWFAAHPALSAAAFVLLGVILGNFAPRWIEQAIRAGSSSPSTLPSLTVLASEAPATDLNVTGIRRLAGSPNAESPRVEVQLTSRTPLVLQGTVDNSEVRQALLYVMQNSQRFPADERFDSVELLKARSSDQEVRRSLCRAARSDRNPGVRLKALEALRGGELDAQLRQTLFQALLEDSNPGVRIEAINALRAVAEHGSTRPDETLLSVLRDRMQKDPSVYIRLQSAAAIRQLAQRGVY